MKVLHVTPTYFGEGSYIGGGERYACELARAMAAHAEVTLLSFADKPARYTDGALRVEHLVRGGLVKHPLFANPFSRRLLKWVRWADVIHCHQAHTIATDAAIILGKLFRKRIFVTDLGGGHKYAPSNYLPLLSRVNALLLISEYSKKLWEQVPLRQRPRRMEVIYGGVDEAMFPESATSRGRAALFVGRLLPHKGIDYLIDAVNPPLTLDVVGRVYSQEYFKLLSEKSRGKGVRFHTALGDGELSEKYRHALTTVLPSVYENCYGQHTLVPELLGLVALESLASGTPVILTDVASLPELVEDGVTGFLVPPNDPGAIREKLKYLHDNPEVAEVMGRRGRESVRAKFTWDAVSRRCLEAYSR